MERKTTSQSKQAKKPANTKSNKPAPKPKKPGVISTIVEAIESAGKEGISKEQILEKLVKKFPDRSALAMVGTINVQVPNRISKERFKVEKVEGTSNYRKAV